MMNQEGREEKRTAMQPREMPGAGRHLPLRDEGNASILTSRQPVIPQHAALVGGGFQDSEHAFPFRIYDLLEDAAKLGFESIVSWIEGGTSFMVFDREQFSKQVS